MSNIFETLQAKEPQESKHDKHIKEAIRTLMSSREGRTFLRWLGVGQSAYSILQLIMDFEEEKHV